MLLPERHLDACIRVMLQTRRLERMLCLVAATGMLMALGHEGQETRQRKEFLAAVRAGNVPAVQRLVDRGVTVELRDATDATPIMIAAETGNGSGVVLLLERGANPNAQTKEG